MCDRICFAKGDAGASFMHGNSWLDPAPGAGCGVLHQLRSVWCQREFYLPASRTPQCVECQPCSVGWQGCFQTLEWAMLWKRDLRHKHPGRKGQRSKVGHRVGIWGEPHPEPFHGEQHLLGFADQTSVFLRASQCHGANPRQGIKGTSVG